MHTIHVILLKNDVLFIPVFCTVLYIVIPVVIIVLKCIVFMSKCLTLTARPELAGIPIIYHQTGILLIVNLRIKL